MIGNPRSDAHRSLAALFGQGVLGGLNDAQLLHRFAVRDGADSELAFAALVERHGPMVLRVCRSIAGDADEDAFQATFLILARKADSLRVIDSLGPWLHQVAYRVASSARAAKLRRQRHERLAAHPGEPVVQGKVPDDLAPIVHEEVQALPAAYRSAVVLCYLQGLTHAQAAERLGCPAGTVQSRLARGRARLRDRLVRRGLDPSAAIAAAPGLSVPDSLLDATARIATLLRAGNLAEIAPPGVARLFQEVAFKGGWKMLKVSLAWMAMATALAVATPGHTSRPAGDAIEEAPTVAAGNGPISAPPGDDRDDGPERVLPRLNFGPIRVGAMVAVQCNFLIEEEEGEGPGMAAKVVPPGFLRIEGIRVRTRPQIGPRQRLVEFGVVLDTARPANLAGRVKIEYGNHKVDLPVIARVLPAEEKATKVLVIGDSFLNNSRYDNQWFKLIDAAALDVSYANPNGNGLIAVTPAMELEAINAITKQRPQPQYGQKIRHPAPEWLRRYDAILVEGGGTGLGSQDIPILQDYVLGGGRLIVSAGDGVVHSVRDSNELVKPFGIAWEGDTPELLRNMGLDPVEVPAITDLWIRIDSLTEGVDSLTFRRPTPIRIAKEGRGNILVGPVKDPSVGLAVAVRDGGEVIAIGMNFLVLWLNQNDERAPENFRFLQNLLARPRVGPR